MNQIMKMQEERGKKHMHLEEKLLEIEEKIYQSSQTFEQQILALMLNQHSHPMSPPLFSYYHFPPHADQ